MQSHLHSHPRTINLFILGLTSTNMSSFEVFNGLVVIYYSRLTLFLQLMTFVFALLFCITRFRQKALWRTLLGCLLDSFVASILARIEAPSSIPWNILKIHFLVLIPLGFYSAVRVVISMDYDNSSSKWWNKDNIHLTSTVFPHISLNLSSLIINI